MPIKEEKAGTRPWIVCIAVAKKPNPTSVSDLFTWASGSIVGRKHILTAAHVCLTLDLSRRLYAIQGLSASLVCIPGFHGKFTTATKVYPIAPSAFKVSKSSIYAKIQYKNFPQYAREIQKAHEMDFQDHDLGMYFLGSDFPGTQQRALFEAPTDADLDPTKKIALMAHGYTFAKRGVLMFAQTRSVRAFPARFALHDAMLYEGASGGPVWRTASPKPLIIGAVSGFQFMNIGGPRRFKRAHPKTGKMVDTIFDMKTMRFQVVSELDPPPPLPDRRNVGISTRITPKTFKEIQEWCK